jgi:glucokinase
MAKQQIDHVKEQNKLSASGNGYVVAVDIGGTNIRLVLADMNGTIAARWSSSTTGSRSANEIIKLMQNGVEHLLTQTSAPREALKAIAAGAPGITNVDEGVVIATSYLLGWRDVPLRDLLEAEFHIPATVDNDVNVAAIGEFFDGAAKGSSDFVFLAIGTGVGAGIILNGQPFRGKEWSAGEIGYMLVPGVPDYVPGRGEPGALESMIGGEGIKTQRQRLWTPDSTTLHKEATATEIFDAALQGDRLAQKLLDQTAHILACAIYNMSLVLNCSLFVLGGSVGMHPALAAATQQVLRQWSERDHLQVVRSQLGTDAQLIGAIRLALSAAHSTT